MRSRKPTRKNPALAEEVVDFPIRQWIDTSTGQTFQTVTLQPDDGSFLSALSHNTSVRSIGPTKQEAEQAVIRKRSQQINPAQVEADEELEDELAVDDFLKREKAGKLSWTNWKPPSGKKHARR